MYEVARKIGLRHVLLALLGMVIFLALPFRYVWHCCYGGKRIKLLAENNRQKNKDGLL